jgi:Mg-chelatase subunit ChlD
MHNTLTNTDTLGTMDSLESGIRAEGTESLEMMVVPPSFQQLGIFVLDGSGSMSESIGKLTKADAVNRALRDLFTRFKASKKRENFSFAVVTFDGSAKSRMGVTAAGQVDDYADYDPRQGHGGGTFIGAGLEEAQSIAEAFLQNARPDLPASVVLVVMSDGACGKGAQTKAIADRIKQNPKVTVCAAYFAVKGQSGTGVLNTLEDIASDPLNGCKTVWDAETLRAFFISSVTAGR